MPNVEHYSLFCEDVRWEANGSPMLAGIMSPVFHPTEYPVTFARIFLVSMFRASNDTEGFSATLSISKTSKEGREAIGEFGAEYERDQLDNEGAQWVAISHLPIPPIELNEGESLVAEVDCEGVSSSVHLFAGSVLSS